jgi:hypothetical protein
MNEVAVAVVLGFLWGATTVRLGKHTSRRLVLPIGFEVGVLPRGFEDYLLTEYIFLKFCLQMTLSFSAQILVV